jgi:hypothetical protein
MLPVDFQWYCGVFAFWCSVVAYVPLARDTLRGTSHPSRETWLIWTVLGAISAFSSIYEGATYSADFGLARVLGSGAILMLAIRHGRGRLLTRLDETVMLLCAGGLVVWYCTDSAVFALALSIGLSALAGLPTVMKCLRAPNTESIATWWLSLFASLLAVAAVGRPDPVLLAYPVYLCVLFSALIAATLIGRTRGRDRKPETGIVVQGGSQSTPI